MESFGPMSDPKPLVLAQQGVPSYGHREAYEGGRKVGEITFYVMVGVVVIWGLLKVFQNIRKRP